MEFENVAMNSKIKILKCIQTIQISLHHYNFVFLQMQKSESGLTADEARQKAESIIRAEKRKRILNMEKEDL